MKQIRLSAQNEKAVIELVKQAGNDLLTIPKAANKAIEKGLPAARKHFIKTNQRKEG